MSCPHQTWFVGNLWWDRAGIIFRTLGLNSWSQFLKIENYYHMALLNSIFDFILYIVMVSLKNMPRFLWNMLDNSSCSFTVMKNRLGRGASVSYANNNYSILLVLKLSQNKVLDSFESLVLEKCHLIALLLITFFEKAYVLEDKF